MKKSKMKNKSIIPRLEHYKYKNAPKKFFRIVKLSDKKYRVDFKRSFLFLSWWDKKIKKYSYFQGFEDGYGIGYEPLIFENENDARLYIEKGSRKLIKFKKPEEKIINF
ncbi:MAG: hypothetical protein ACOC1K_01635 [Nanoarchaeota archaeon]